MRWAPDYNPDLGDKDPTLLGDVMEIAGEGSWQALFDVPGIDSDETAVFSKRSDDGVTTSVDSGIPVDQLIMVIQGLSADDH